MSDSDQAAVEEPQKKKRGRPRMTEEQKAAAKAERERKKAEAAAAAAAGEAPAEPAKKGPGRPRKSAAGAAKADVAAAEVAEAKPKGRTVRTVHARKAEAEKTVAVDEASKASGKVAEPAGMQETTPQDEAKAAKADGSVAEDKANIVVRKNRRQDGDGSRQQNGHRNNNQNDRSQQGKQKHNNDRRNRRDRNRNNREVVPSVTREELAELKVGDLRTRAAELDIDVSGMKKSDLVDVVYEASVRAEGFIEVEGILDIMSDGYGFLRTQGYLPGEADAYVGASMIRRNGLRKGDMVRGQTRPARENDKFAAIQKIIAVNGVSIEECAPRPKFADLTPVYPDERLIMEHGKNTITARVIDLAAPIGKGQRGLIVSPPKAGKTTVLKDIAASITANNPEVHLMCLLVDERPEEVTDMERSVKGEVVSSTFDMPCENHIAVAELVIERAKRLVEGGQDVVILLDSITRLARAYNLAQPASGRILSGGVDSTALYPPKRFLGAARNIEGGGSLTILASALIDTGSKMDEVIFEEFKGTGNMELKLDRNLADRRIFPAIDPVTSGTRKEDLLLDPQEAPLIWAVRRILSNMNNTERAMDMLIKSLKQTDNNQEFLMRTAKKAQMQHGKIDEGFSF